MSADRKSKRVGALATKRAVSAWSRNARRAVVRARGYLTTARACLDRLEAGERGHVCGELRDALRGVGHMLDDIDSGTDGDPPGGGAP